MARRHLRASIPVQAQARLLLARRGQEDVRAVSYKEFVRRVMPEYRWYPHCEAMARGVQALIDGTVRKLFIAAPQQAGKTTTAELAAAYWLYRERRKWAAVSSYGDDLATTISESVRDRAVRAGLQLRPDTFGKNRWRILDGGGLWAKGIGGGLNGNPSNFLVADDWVKNPDDAASPTVQRRNWNLYATTWKGRWNSFAGPLFELMIGTRWDVADIQGKALVLGGWHCVILPGIYPDEPIEIPQPEDPDAPRNTLEADWRKPGEPLCPELEKFALPSLERMRTEMGRFYFNALVQQSPQDCEGGGYFKRWWLPVLAVDPALAVDVATGKVPGESVYSSTVRAWDLAASKEKGDKTVGLLMSKRRDNGRIVIRDGISARLGPGGVKRLMAETMIRDGSGVIVNFPVDPGQAGKAQELDLTAFLREEARRAGMTPPKIKTSPTQGSKLARFKPFRAAAEPVSGTEESYVPGNVDIVRGRYLLGYLDELHNFDGKDGHEDDWADATSDGYARLTGHRSVRSFVMRG